MIYIATTTINKPTKALKLFAKNKNCRLIVALDKKSKKFDFNSLIFSGIKLYLVGYLSTIKFT